jgi:hypothetical protein
VEIEARKTAEADAERVKAEKRKADKALWEARSRNVDIRKAKRAAREAEREKHTDLKKTTTVEWKRKVKEARENAHRLAREKAEADSKAQVAKLTRAVAAARKRARAKEAAAAETGRQKRLATTAKLELKRLQETLEEEAEDESEEEDEAESEDEEAKGADARTGTGSRRRDARGRFGTMPQSIRVLVWAQLSRRVAPSAVASNISDAIGARPGG